MSSLTQGAGYLRRHGLFIKVRLLGAKGKLGLKILVLFLCAWHGVCRQESGLWARELWELERDWRMCVYWGAGENDPRAGNSLFSLDGLLC